MLHDLIITNFALIDELSVSFDEGLNILSGETGAGKSILIGAVSLLLGDRAASDMIRSQADTATVEALFDISDNPVVREKLSELGFAVEDDLVIRRVISRGGKNKVLVNGQMATLGHLSAISESLINICGQHEHQVILSADHHIDILDEVGGCLEAREAYQVVYERVMDIRRRMAELEALRGERAKRVELIEFQLSEIRDVNPLPEEDVALADEKKVLQNAQKLLDAAGRARDLLYAETGSVTEKIKEALSRIRDIQKIDPSLGVSDAEVEGAYILLQETAMTLRDYEKKLVFDPDRLTVIDERLEALGRLKRKHGGAIELVLEQKARMEDDLLRVTHIDDEIASLAALRDEADWELAGCADRLSALRRDAAVRLKDAVDREMTELNMHNAAFFPRFLNDDGAGMSYGPKGGDDMEFYLQANLGEEPRPLNRIASGGELSRIILALKNVLAKTGSVDTVVFDEVDSGIGGATAEIVGRKLKEVALNHQVICITHLPQIACFGSRHLRVAKSISDGRTATQVEPLNEEQRIEEISRMLGGVEMTSTARQHARQMLTAAQSVVG